MKRKNALSVGVAFGLFLVLMLPLFSIVYAFPAWQTQNSCPGLLASRLVVGEQGRVSTGGANNMRAEANTGGDMLGQIPANSMFIVLEGPVCADGFAWWRVDYNGTIGWTAEGQGSTYWLEPMGPLEATLTPSPTPVDDPAISCPGFLPSRLIVGEQGRVVPGPANNMRAEALSSSALLTEIPGGATFLVLEGPTCAAGLAWWRVDYRGTVGWTAEGSGDTYWVEPAGPVPTPAPTLTPSMTFTPSATLTPRPTLTPSLTPTHIPPLPPAVVPAGVENLHSQPIASEHETLTGDNMYRLSLLSVVGQGGVNEIAMTPDGLTLIVLNSLGVWWNDLDSDDGTRLLDTRSFLPTKMAISPNGRYLALGGESYPNIPVPTVQIWDLTTMEPLSRFSGFDLPIHALKFTPDSQQLAVGSFASINQQSDIVVWLMDISSDTMRSIEMPFQSRVSSIDFTPDGQSIAVSSIGGEIEIYNVAINEHQLLYEIVGSIDDVLFSPTGGELLTAGSGGAANTPGVLRIWDMVTSERILSPQFTQGIYQLAISQDSSTLAMQGWSTVWVWDLDTMSEITEIRRPVQIKSMTFNPDGQLILGYVDGQVNQWDIAEQTSDLLFDFGGPATYDAVAISPSGLFIAMELSRQGEVQVWDMTTGDVLGTFDTNFDDVSYLAFGAGETVLNFIVGDRRTVWTLQTNTQEETATDFIQPRADTTTGAMDVAYSLYSGYGARYRLQSAQFIPDTSMLFVDEGTAFTIWDIEARLPLVRYRHFGDLVGFSADNSVMLTRTDSAVWVWGIPENN